MRRRFGTSTGMSSVVQKGVASLAVLVLLGGTLVSQRVIGASGSDKGDGRRSFYLTTSRYGAVQAPNACAADYHMASMWEILDPSNLRYDTTLGVTQQDTGGGPPSIQFGWVRTARSATAVGIEGVGNCRAWTSNSADDHGTAVMLGGIWRPEAGSSPIDPWRAASATCDLDVAVWCVQN